MPVSVALRWPSFARSAPVRAAFAAGRPLSTPTIPLPGCESKNFAGSEAQPWIYGRQPIVDHFRKIDDHRVLGLMEMRGMERPFFFLLIREQTLNVARS
jgi:hypothetical protein